MKNYSFEVIAMTDKKRITISLPVELAEEVKRIKASPEFCDKPMSEVFRSLIRRGLDLQ